MSNFVLNSGLVKSTKVDDKYLLFDPDYIGSYDYYANRFNLDFFTLKRMEIHSKYTGEEKEKHLEKIKIMENNYREEIKLIEDNYKKHNLKSCDISKDDNE